jgi:hypothetical protein
MYEREFQFVMPVQDENAVEHAVSEITGHFKGSTRFPLVKGRWVKEKTGEVIKDDNTLIVSTRQYSDKEQFPHPFAEHRKDIEFMEKLAQEIAKTTKQECIFEQEGLIGRCAFIAPKTEEKKLEKMI